MLLLARTTPLGRGQEEDPTGCRCSSSICGTPRRGMRLRPIRNMVNHETNEVFFDNFVVPAENLIGEEGKGFRYILDGMNAERILIAAECIGDGCWFIEKARTLRQRARGIRPADRAESGRAVPDRAALHERARRPI